MSIPRPTKPFSAIILTASLSSGKIIGEPGNQIEVTDENREAAIALYQDRGCRLVLDAVPATPVATSETPEPEVEEDSDEGLADLDDASSIDELDIAPRYKAALKDAGISTIAEAKAHADLANIPGMTAKVAEKIKAA